MLKGAALPLKFGPREMADHIAAFNLAGIRASLNAVQKSEKNEKGC